MAWPAASQEQAAKIALTAELTAAISQFLRHAIGYTADGEGFLHHGFQGPFDEDCYLLWQLGAASAKIDAGVFSWQEGVALQASDPNVLWPLFRLKEPDRARAIVKTAELPPEDAVMNRLINAFVASFCEYGMGSKVVPHQRRHFPVPSALMPAFRELSNSGYCELSNDQARWTDKIGPAMVAAHLWEAETGGERIEHLHVPQSLAERVATLAHSDKLAAIVLLRAEAGASLLQAKTFVDQCVARSHH